MNESISTKKWTVMVYLAGDNNLSEDMVTALKGMQSVGSNTNINLLACYDSVHPMIPITYYRFEEGNEDRPLSSYGVEEISLETEAAQAPTKILSDFVKWCSEGHPASNYILILSGHGDGIRGKTILSDENPFSTISLVQWRVTLEEIKKSYLKKELAILGFDSCFMSMLETAYEFRNTANIMISSEGTIPNSGWVYEKMLRRLVETNGTKSDEDYAEDFVREFAQHNYDYAVSGRSIDLSACYLNEDKIQPVLDGINNLGKCLGAEMQDLFLHQFLTQPGMLQETDENSVQNSSESDDIKEFVKEQVKKLILSAHWEAQTFLHDQAVDIKDFCERLAIQSAKLREDIDKIVNGSNDKETENEYTKKLAAKLDEVENICRELGNAIDQFVIKSCYSGYEYQYSNGISVFFPWSLLSLYISKNSYQKLSFFDDGVALDWIKFIFNYLQETLRKPRDREFNKEFGEKPPIFRFFTDPPIFKGASIVFDKYFERTKNDTPYVGIPQCSTDLIKDTDKTDSKSLTKK